MIIATKNAGKAQEFKEMLTPFGIHVQTLLDFAEEMPDVEETGETFQDNAQLKAEQIAAKLQKPVIADDSGLVVDYLNGRPGVYSARYAGNPTDDRANYEKVLTELSEAEKKERTARFVCVLAFAQPGKPTIFKEGTCEGLIAREPKGSNGFGYDPIFIPEGYEVTMAQLEQQVKNKLSHRYHALKAFQAWLQQERDRD